MNSLTSQELNKLSANVYVTQEGKSRIEGIISEQNIQNGCLVTTELTNERELRLAKPLPAIGVDISNVMIYVSNSDNREASRQLSPNKPNLAYSPNNIVVSYPRELFMNSVIKVNDYVSYYGPISPASKNDAYGYRWEITESDTYRTSGLKIQVVSVDHKRVELEFRYANN